MWQWLVASCVVAVVAPKTAKLFSPFSRSRCLSLCVCPSLKVKPSHNTDPGSLVLFFSSRVRKRSRRGRRRFSRSLARSLALCVAPGGLGTMYNVVRNSLMPAAGVRGNLRDREPQMSSLLAWSAENDEEEEDAASSLANGSRREPLLGQAVRDRWESEAHQQFRYYTVNHATPVEEGNRLSHTHQYTQHTRHLEQQQQQQIQEFNQRRRPTVERHLHPHPHEGAPAVDEQENTNLGVVSAPSSGDTLASQPLVDSGPARGANARPLTAGPGGQRPKGNAKTAAAKHIERMQAARRRKNKANTARQPRVYTSREMPDSTAARKLKQAPFHAYGRGNTHPVTKYVGGLVWQGFWFCRKHSRPVALWSRLCCRARTGSFWTGTTSKPTT